MSDLVERLRKHAECNDDDHSVAEEAADYIEELEAEVADWKNEPAPAIKLARLAMAYMERKGDTSITWGEMVALLNDQEAPMQHDLAAPYCESFDHLRERNNTRGEEWGGADTNTPTGFLIELLFRSNELGGEAGEAQNVAKKLARGYMDMPGGETPRQSKQALADELADTIICCDRVADMFDIDLAVAVAVKFNKTSKKHGFETEFN